MSLKRKIILTVIGSYILITGILIVGIILYYKSDFKKIRIKTGEAILNSNESDIIYSALIENKKILKTIAESLKNTGIIDYLVVKKNNNLIFSNKNSSLKSPIVIIKNITCETLNIPANIAIEMGVNINDFKTYLKTAISLLLFSFVLITLCFIILIFFSLSKLFEPLNSLNKALSMLSYGTYKKLQIPKYKELKPIAISYNILVDSLNEKERKIQQQIEEIKEKNKLLKEQLAEIQSLQKILVNKEKLAALGTVVAGIAHEINNPIAAIRGLCELTLIKQNIDFKIQQNLKKIINYCDRVSNIIKSLKIYGKSEEFSQKGYYLISEIIKDAIDMEKYGNILKNVKIKGNFENSKEKILCKKEELIQVFINLINNSVEAMNGKGEININIKRNKDFLEIHFSDTGPGIPEEIKDKIFEPFFTTKGTKGTGLGLFIVYRLIHKNNGDIFLKNCKKGAYFIIKFNVGVKNEKDSNN